MHECKRFKLVGEERDLKHFGDHDLAGRTQLLECVECGATRRGLLKPERYIYTGRSKYGYKGEA